MAEYVINQYRGVFKRAMELYENEKFKDSFLLFETVVQNDPANYQAAYFLGEQLYYGKGCPKNVKRAFQFIHRHHLTRIVCQRQNVIHR